MDREALASISAFLREPNAQSLSELAEVLENEVAASRLLKLAGRAVYLEDERLGALLQEAVAEARRLLEG